MRPSLTGSLTSEPAGPVPIAAAHHYRPDIDGQRAIAISLVLVFHAFPESLPGGFVGVDVFFVISGCLISGLIFTDLAKERFSSAVFQTRCIRRILPAPIPGAGGLVRPQHRAGARSGHLHLLPPLHPARFHLRGPQFHHPDTETAAGRPAVARSPAMAIPDPGRPPPNRGWHSASGTICWTSPGRYETF